MLLPNSVDHWMSTCEDFYGEKLEEAVAGNRSKGLCMKMHYKSPEGEGYGTLTLTFYPQTFKIHVQGNSFGLWLHEHLTALSKRVQEAMNKDGLLPLTAAASTRKSKRSSKQAVQYPPLRSGIRVF